jgi:hypothetical protein
VVGGDWLVAGSVVVDDGSVLVGAVDASVAGAGSDVGVVVALSVEGSVLAGAVLLVSVAELSDEVEESVLAGGVAVESSALAGGVALEPSGLEGEVLPLSVESVLVDESDGSVALVEPASPAAVEPSAVEAPELDEGGSPLEP